MMQAFVHCYSISLIQYPASLRTRETGKNNEYSKVLELDNHESYDYNKKPKIYHK